MSDTFNPYHRWLGIPPKDQRPDHYRLLGVERFESDSEVIRDASERQISHVRRYASGAHADLANRLLNELATVRACLLNSANKAVYDQHLRDQIAGQNPPPVTPARSVTKHSGQRRPKSPLVVLVKIALGGIAGLLIGVLLLWYGFGMDVLGVMDSGDEGTAKRVTQGDADVKPKPPHKEDPRHDRTREPAADSVPEALSHDGESFEAVSPSQAQCPIVGRYVFLASNKMYLDYTFSPDGTVSVNIWSDLSTVESGKVKPSDDPKTTAAAWQEIGDDVVIYIFFKDETTPGMQRIEFRKDGKINGFHWSRISQESLEGRKYK